MNLSSCQGGRQSEERTMQGDETLSIHRPAFAAHPPGSQARPSSLKGGPNTAPTVEDSHQTVGGGRKAGHAPQ